MTLKVEPEALGLAQGGQLADRVLLEEGGVHVGDAHQGLLAGRLVLLNCLLERCKAGAVVLRGRYEPARINTIKSCKALVLPYCRRR